MNPPLQGRFGAVCEIVGLLTIVCSATLIGGILGAMLHEWFVEWRRRWRRRLKARRSTRRSTTATPNVFHIETEAGRVRCRTTR